LVDHFESDGKRYVLARRNDVKIGGAEALSERERQAIGFAALGHNNKLIAYEMGISPSTVSVLLLRGARKLGSKTRDEMIAHFVKKN
jgi:DNA-binding CsgD family transcriptional regulator